MWNRRRQRLLRALALGLAIAAVAAPAVQAKLAIEPGEGKAAPVEIVGVRSDVPPSPAVVPGRARPDVPPATVPASAPATVGDGFDWRDAGIGAGLALGAVLLAAAAALARRHGRLAGI
jgi:hypothetical protein